MGKEIHIAPLISASNTPLMKSVFILDLPVTINVFLLIYIMASIS